MPEFSALLYEEWRGYWAEHLGRDIGKLHYGKNEELFLLKPMSERWYLKSTLTLVSK